MSFLGVLLALFLDAVVSASKLRKVQAPLRQITEELEVDLEALGAPRWVWLQWLFPVALWALAVSLFHGVLADWSLLLAGIFSVLVLFFGLRFSPFVQVMTSLQLYLNQGDHYRAREMLLDWMNRLGSPVPTIKGDQAVIRHAIDHGVERIFRQFFAPVFWFVALPGPTGVAIYLCVWWSALRERHLSVGELAGEWPTLHQSVKRLGYKAMLSPRFVLYILEWLPARLMALAMMYRLQWAESIVVWRNTEDHTPLSNRALLVSLAHLGLQIQPKNDISAEVLVDFRKWVSEAVIIWLLAVLILSVGTGLF